MGPPFNTRTCPPVLLCKSFSKISHSLTNSSHIRKCWKKKTELHDFGRICLGQIVVLLCALPAVPLKTVCGSLGVLHLLFTNQKRKANVLCEFGISCATEWVTLIICVHNKERKPSYLTETVYYVQISPRNFPELHRSYHRLFTRILCSPLCLLKPLSMLNTVFSEYSQGHAASSILSGFNNNSNKSWKLCFPKTAADPGETGKEWLFPWESLLCFWLGVPKEGWESW